MVIETVKQLKDLINNIDDNTKVGILTGDGETHSFFCSVVSKETLTEEEYSFYDKDKLPFLMLHI
jgi:1,4-dihydroxy-2-naphthoyl-CoA synthase